MNNKLSLRKIFLYIFFSFSISWSVALAMHLTGVKYGSLTAIGMIAFLFMPGPAMAVFIVQKLIYKQNFYDYGWTFNVKQKYQFLQVLLLFFSLIILSMIVIYCFGNTHLIENFGQLDFSQQVFQNNISELLSKNGVPSSQISEEVFNNVHVTPFLAFTLIIISGIISSFTLNLPFMFGEEFGWRGMLLKECQSLGFFKSSVLIGLVWGLWHAPIIAMGHNYPNQPFLGIIMMCLFTLSLSPLFTYVRFKTKSILGPCLLHGLINSTSAIFILFIDNKNEFYNSIAGWAGIIAGLLVTIGIYFFDNNFVKNFNTH